MSKESELAKKITEAVKTADKLAHDIQAGVEKLKKVASEVQKLTSHEDSSEKD